MAKTKYLIHKTNTPKIAIIKGRLTSAGLWWHGTGWGDSHNATTFDTNDEPLPEHGEWVEIYVNEPVL